MADDMDRAQAREQLDRTLALQAVRQRAAECATSSNHGRCMDCDEPIEPLRLKALNGCCNRCAECAQAEELRARRYA